MSDFDDRTSRALMEQRQASSKQRPINRILRTVESTLSLVGRAKGACGAGLIALGMRMVSADVELT